VARSNCTTSRNSGGKERAASLADRHALGRVSHRALPDGGRIAVLASSASPGAALLEKITATRKGAADVIAHALPSGLRGLALAPDFRLHGDVQCHGQRRASYLVRDVYQRYLRPQAGNRELVYASYGASILFIGVGLGISLGGQSINRMFTWIMAALGRGCSCPMYSVVLGAA